MVELARNHYTRSWPTLIRATSPTEAVPSNKDTGKPRIGIYDGNTDMKLSEAVKKGLNKSGMLGFRFNQAGISSATSMGGRGMHYSLLSRDLTADVIETAMDPKCDKGNISIPGSVNDMVGAIMAMGQHNQPSIMIYGRTSKVHGGYVMYSANTMGYAIETMEISLPYSSSTPSEDSLKLEECRRAGEYLLEFIKMDLKPQDIITPKSICNAMAIVMALGGSTNAVLHLLAIARSFCLDLTLDDFQKVSDEVPLLADLKPRPSHQYIMEDVHKSREKHWLRM